MDLNKGNTISFIRRHRLFLGALVVGLLNCIFLFTFSTSNHAYFSIISNNSQYTIISKNLSERHLS